MAKDAIANWEKISDRHFLVTILSFLIDPSKGGTGFTDYLGHWAYRAGYDGILFFGARAIDSVPNFKDYIENGADDGMAGPLVHGYFHEMRRREDLKNLVMFSGARLTGKIKTIRLLPEPAVSNPYHGSSDAAIDARLEFNAGYQAEQASNGFYLAQPFTIE